MLEALGFQEQNDAEKQLTDLIFDENEVRMLASALLLLTVDSLYCV